MTLQARILKKQKFLFSINNKLKRTVSTIIASKPKIENLKDGIACFILAKSFKTYLVALKLARSGYTEDSEMLLRTLFDSYLIIAAVMEDISEKTALKFLSFDYVTRDRMYKKIKDKPIYTNAFIKRKINPKPDDENLEMIEKRAELWKKEFKNPQKWHAPQTAGQLAESLDIKNYYETAYDMQSQLIHSLPRVMNRYIIEDHKSLSIDITPKDKNVDMCLISAFNMMILITNKVVKHYGLNLGKRLDKLVLEYREAAKQST